MHITEKTKTKLRAAETYAPSRGVEAARQTYEAVRAARPADYASRYDDEIRAAYEKIMNRPAFSYDAAGDPLYGQYRSQYVRQGRRAMEDTLGRAAALTGGYLSSYGATAGQQAYQQYLEELNEVIPQLYDRAYDRYLLEGQALKERYDSARSAEAADYERWADAYDRWAQEAAAAEDTYQTERGFDYGKFADDRSHWLSRAQMEQTDHWKGRSQAYDTALTLLKSGQTPGAALLEAAGISQADLAALKAAYAPARKSGSSKAKQPQSLVEQIVQKAQSAASAQKSKLQWLLKGR